MPREIGWTLAARRDLLAAVRHLVEEDARDAASRLLDEVEAAAGSLGEFSERGRIVPELGVPRRELIVGRYRLVYRIRGEGVQILRLIHGRQDFLSAWKTTLR